MPVVPSLLRLESDPDGLCRAAVNFNARFSAGTSLRFSAARHLRQVRLQSLFATRPLLGQRFIEQVNVAIQF